MQVTGMLYGSKLLQFVGFPTSEVLGPSASEEEIKALIDRHGSVFIPRGFALSSSGFARARAAVSVAFRRS